MVLGIQLAGILFALVMIYLTFLYYKRNNYSTRSFILWMVIWAAFLIATFYPQSLYGVMETLTIERTVDFFVIAGFMFFTVVIFYIYLTVKNVERAVDQVVRKVALDRAKKPVKKAKKR